MQPNNPKSDRLLPRKSWQATYSHESKHRSKDIIARIQVNYLTLLEREGLLVAAKRILSSCGQTSQFWGSFAIGVSIPTVPTPHPNRRTTIPLSLEEYLKKLSNPTIATALNFGNERDKIWIDVPGLPKSIQAIAATTINSSQVVVVFDSEGQAFVRSESTPQIVSQRTGFFFKSKPEEPAKEETGGNVKILFAKLNVDHWDLYIGGDRDTPTKIGEAAYYFYEDYNSSSHPSKAEGLTYGYITNLGTGKNDWVVGIQEQRAALKSGSGNLERNWEKRRYLRTIYPSEQFEVEDTSFGDSPVTFINNIVMPKESIWLGGGAWHSDLVSFIILNSNVERFSDSFTLFLNKKSTQLSFIVEALASGYDGGSIKAGGFIFPADRGIPSQPLVEYFSNYNWNQATSTVSGFTVIPGLNISEAFSTNLGVTAWFYNTFGTYFLNKNETKALLIRQQYKSSASFGEIPVNRILYIYNKDEQRYRLLDISSLDTTEEFRAFLETRYDYDLPTGSSRQAINFVKNSFYCIKKPVLLQSRTQVLKRTFVNDSYWYLNCFWQTTTKASDENIPIDADKEMEIVEIEIQEDDNSATLVKSAKTEKAVVKSLQIGSADKVAILAMSYHPSRTTTKASSTA